MMIATNLYGEAIYGKLKGKMKRDQLPKARHSVAPSKHFLKRALYTLS